jgi:hypothetical protein
MYQFIQTHIKAKIKQFLSKSIKNVSGTGKNFVVIHLMKRST